MDDFIRRAGLGLNFKWTRTQCRHSLPDFHRQNANSIDDWLLNEGFHHRWYAPYGDHTHVNAESVVYNDAVPVWFQVAPTFGSLSPPRRGSKVPFNTLGWLFKWASAVVYHVRNFSHSLLPSIYDDALLEIIFDDILISFTYIGQKI